ncbi:MAG: iron-containing alcohol dehydrogenase [Bacteroidaceae bacterium]|nr:iron-containing alcohol dehydrogenase [Bacteroidaceae bacterium]
MKALTINLPSKLVFGTGCMKQFCEDYVAMGFKRLFIVTQPIIRPAIAESEATLKAAGIDVAYFEDIAAEPTVNDFKRALKAAEDFGADSVLGVGGGSVLDVAKLVATLIGSEQKIEDLYGIGFVSKRGKWFACVPTTAGTGSEMSPNAILLDETDNGKKGIISPYLMASAAYIDPQLTWTVPAKVTADTGIDALTHCIEAYINKFAHPMIDLYALEGIRLIAANIKKAVENGKDVEAREALALGSMYGGMCLGPVNTAAVHALAYPIGGEYHISHGASNAVLLAKVMEFNMSANVEKYAKIAIACGCEPGENDEETAKRGVQFVANLCKEIGIPQTLTEMGIPKEAAPQLAKAAMDCQRLLRNNPREVTEQDALNIYGGFYKLVPTS